MKYHTFLKKMGKTSQNLPSAAVVIGALRVKKIVKRIYKIQTSGINSPIAGAASMKKG